MPGGRLTERDRHRIESALATGARAAAIARELGRPASTISREIARNGGRTRYRAAHAQRATDWRAHRRATTPAGRPERHDDFTAEFVAVLVRTGLPAMVARVLVCLMTDDAGRLTGAELAARLRVSRASVSKAVGYLETLSMLRRERATGRRREHYVLRGDALRHVWADNTLTNALWADIAGKGATLLGPGTPAGSRLHDIAVFFTDLNVHMSRSPDVALITDAVTVAAALAHAGSPLPPARLATALGWPAGRIHRALRTAADHPWVTGPLIVRPAAGGAVTAVADLSRLTGAQTRALTS